MKPRRWSKYLLLLLFMATSVLFAKQYDKTSFYAAYDPNDNTQYVLVMPMVNKVYTHKAGHIKPEDLKQIDDQFSSFPTYNNGKLCFSDLKSDASGDNGADILAGQCYYINFFYTQKEYVDEGAAFILTYTRETGGDKVYEGLAGKSDTFKVVREGDKVFNENSITGDDYSMFRFDKATATVIIGEESEGVASISGIVNPITGAKEELTVSVSLDIDMDGDGTYDGKADKHISATSKDGSFTLKNIGIASGQKVKAQLTVTVEGYAPYKQIVTLSDGASVNVDASAAMNKPVLKEVVNLEDLSPSARMNSVVVFGIRKDSGKLASYARLMSLSEFRAQADVPMKGGLSEFSIGTDTIPSNVKTLEATMQAFDSTKAEDIKNFPGEFKGKGLNRGKFAADDVVGLESAAFDMFVMKDQDGNTVQLSTPKNKLGSNVDLSTCTNTWKRYITTTQRDLILKWGDFDKNTTEFEVPIWSNDNSEGAWKFVGVGNLYDYDTDNAYFKVCIPDDWGSGYLNCDSPITFTKPVNMCVDFSDQVGAPIEGMTVNGKTSRGTYAYGYSNDKGRASFELQDTNVSDWSFTYYGPLTGWATMDINATPVKVDTDECTYELNVTGINNPYIAEVRVTALDREGNPVGSGYSVQLYNYDSTAHYYSKWAYTDENGTALFKVEPNVDYTATYGAGSAAVNVDGTVVAPETADSGSYADVTVQDVNKAPYAYLWLSTYSAKIGQAQSVRIYLDAYDDNGDPIALGSLTANGVDVDVSDASISSWNGYYYLSVDYNISTIGQDTNITFKAVVNDGSTDSAEVTNVLELRKNRAPVIQSPMTAYRTNGGYWEYNYIDVNGSVLKRGTYELYPSVYDPDGDSVTYHVWLDENTEVNGSIDVGAGDHSFKVVADDGETTSIKYFYFTVGNQAPVISQAGISPSKVNIFESDQQITLYAYANDPDGDGIAKVTATLSGDGNQSYELSCNSGTSSYYCTYTMSASELGVGEYTFDFVATDGAGAQSAKVSKIVKITSKNRAPYFTTPLTYMSVEKGKDVVLSVAAVDPEGGRLSFVWNVDGSPYSGTPTSNGTGQESIVLKDLSLGEHEVNCTVSDPEGAIASTEANITVYDPEVGNPLTVWTGIPNMIVSVHDTKSLKVLESNLTDEEGRATFMLKGSETTFSVAFDPNSTIDIQAVWPDLRRGVVSQAAYNCDNNDTIAAKCPSYDWCSHDYYGDSNPVPDWMVTAAFANIDANITGDKLDIDGDGNVTAEEMEKIADRNGDGKVTWREIGNTGYMVKILRGVPIKDYYISYYVRDESWGYDLNYWYLYEKCYSDNDDDMDVYASEDYHEDFDFNLIIKDANGTIRHVEVSGSGYGYDDLDENETDMNVSVHVYRQDENGLYDLMITSGDGYWWNDMNYTNFLFDMRKADLEKGIVLDAKTDLDPTVWYDYNVTNWNYDGDMHAESADVYLKPSYAGIGFNRDYNCYHLWDQNVTSCQQRHSDKFDYTMDSYIYYDYYDDANKWVWKNKYTHNYYVVDKNALPAVYDMEDYPMLDVDMNVSVDRKANGLTVRFTGTEKSKVDYTTINFHGYMNDANNSWCIDGDDWCETFQYEIVSISQPTEDFTVEDMNETIPASMEKGFRSAVVNSSNIYAYARVVEFKNITGMEYFDRYTDYGYYYDYYYGYKDEPLRGVYVDADYYNYNDGDRYSALAEFKKRTQGLRRHDRGRLVNPFAIQIDTHIFRAK